MAYEQFVNIMGYSSIPSGFLGLFLVLLVWTIVWKGIALWKSARNGSKPWFIVMLLLNTVGILEIIYVFFFSKKKNETHPQQ